MNLLTFLERAELELRSENGFCFIPLGGDASFAGSLRRILQEEFPGFVFLCLNLPVWGTVITVAPPDNPKYQRQVLSDRRAERIASDSFLYRPKKKTVAQPQHIEREHVPAFVDALDIQLATIIAQSQLGEEEP